LHRPAKIGHSGQRLAHADVTWFYIPDSNLFLEEVMSYETYLLSVVVTEKTKMHAHVYTFTASLRLDLSDVSEVATQIDLVIVKGIKEIRQDRRRRDNGVIQSISHNLIKVPV